MAVQTFSVADLPALDAEFAEAVRLEFDDLVKDCRLRPGEKGARKLTITYELVPMLGVDSKLRDVEVGVSSKQSRPAMKSRSHTMRPDLREDGGADLLFNDLSRDNPRQLTLDDEADKSSKGKGGKVKGEQPNLKVRSAAGS